MINDKLVLVSESMTALEAIKLLESSELKILFVTNVDKQLVGVITDGDIRRALLKEIPLTDKVTRFMNPNPVFAFQKDLPAKRIQLLKEKQVQQLPIVDENKKIIDIFFYDNIDSSKICDTPVVLMVGGLGTRLGDLTADIPKPMLEVGGRPILETIIENFKSFGFYKFYFAVNYQAGVIENHFKNGSSFGVSIEYLREETKLGTAGALSLLPDNIESPIIVMNGDVLTKVNVAKLIETHIKQKSLATMCVRQYDYQVPFGVIKTTDGKITEIQEKPKQSFFVNSGIYCLSVEAIRRIPKAKQYDMTTLFNELITTDKDKVEVFLIHEYWLDIGRPDDFNRAQFDFKKVF